MDVQTHFHVKEGTGANSYAQNSSFQKEASEVAKRRTMESVKDVYLALKLSSMVVADLGCASGPNTLSFIKDVVKTVEFARCNAASVDALELWVYLNDLPTNDFNSIFLSLPRLFQELKDGAENSSPSIFVAGFPGSFYGRLFADHSLHFVHASYSLHWLSKVPPGIYDEHGVSRNKGKIYISETSPPMVVQAYQSQFREDFTVFLQSRSRELITGGGMALIILGRVSSDHVDRGNSFYWEILSRSLNILKSKGMVAQSKIDNYDVHFYAPSRDEIEEGVRRNGCFGVVAFETLRTAQQGGGRLEGYGKRVSMAVRAVQEKMLSCHFGTEILDPLFDIYAGVVDEEAAKKEIEPVAFHVVLRKQESDG